MSEVAASNKRIAKNTMMLYFRMLITLLVSLYTSRIILDTLGELDFGISGVVLGVVVILTFLKTSLNGSTSRFLMIEIGASNPDNFKKVFSTALMLHLCLAVLVFCVAETAGLWFVENKLNIPPNRLSAAIIAYHFFVLVEVFAIIQVVYNSLLVAYERMAIYAYLSVLDVCLKLGVVYLLYTSNSDRLITYSCLIFVASAFVTVLYQVYCFYNFKVSRFRFSLVDKKTTKSILTFFSWNLSGTLSATLSGQGVNIMQNLFFGPLINAAMTISYQVLNGVVGFAENLLNATKPQLMKSYATGDFPRMSSLLIYTSKFSFFILLIMCLPLIIENEFVLHLWLKKVPNYTVVFCQLTLVYNLIFMLFRSLSTLIHATGRIKRLSFITGAVSLMVLPISYVLLKMGFSPITPLIVNIFLLLLTSASSLYITKLYIPSFSVFRFGKEVILNVLIVVLLSSILPLSLHYCLEDGWVRFLGVCLSSIISAVLAVYCVGLNKDLRIMVCAKINSLLKR